MLKPVWFPIARHHESGSGLVYGEATICAYSNPVTSHCNYSDWTGVRLLPTATILDTLQVNHSASGVRVTEDLALTIL